MYFKYNEHEKIEELKAKFKSCDADMFSIFNPFVIEKKDLQFLSTKEKYNNYVEFNDGYKLKANIPNKCRNLWRTMIIDWNGDIESCCYAKVNSYVGNFESGLSTVWHREYLTSLRNKVLKNRESVESCRLCAVDTQAENEQVYFLKD